MGWTRKLVSDYGECADAVADFVTRTIHPGSVTADAGNTGNGEVFGLSSDTDSVVEDWTLTCTTAGGNGTAVFSVTGSVSGAQADATAGQPYYNGLCSFTILGGSTDFALTDEFTFSMASSSANWVAERALSSTTRMGTVTTNPGNTGNGSITSLVGVASDAWYGETWTVTCKTAGGAGVATFSVVGSVSGTKADATSDSAYTNGQFNMTITAGAVDFVVGDYFTFTQRPFEYILKGKGAGTDEIYVGIRETTDASTYYNWNLQGFTGYISANSFEDQPGYKIETFSVQSNSSYSYVDIIESSRRIIVLPVIGGVYAQVYLGWIIPIATPSQWDYPLFKGGTAKTNSTTLSNRVDSVHSAWWDTSYGYYYGKMYNNAVWDDDVRVWPYMSYGNQTKSPTGDYPLLPVTLINQTAGEYAIYGEAEGCFYVPGRDVNSSNAIIVGTEIYIITQNTWQTYYNDFMAVKLT